SLDPSDHSVSGRGRIRFTNRTAAPVTELLFHLYMNAFRDRHSVFMRESGGQLRRQGFSGAGSIDIRSLALGDGTDLLAGAERELIPGDFTQLRVALPKPLAPGDSLEAT